MATRTVQFVPERKVFFIDAADAARPAIDVRYEFEWEHIPSYEGLLLTLWSSSLPESQVLRAQADAGQTVGWLCTVSALTSMAHEYATDKYFRKAAGHATQLLLEQEWVQEEIAANPHSGLDALPDGVCVLILKKDLLPEVIANTPRRIIPLLHQYGFTSFPVGDRKPHSCGNLAQANLLVDGQRLRNIKLRPIADEVPFQEFIDSLFRNALAVTQDPAYRFFLYYQVIELLMEVVQKQKTLLFAQDLRNAADDATKLFELKEALGKRTSEQSRLHALFETYTSVPAELLSGLQIESLNFLNTLGRGDDVDSPSKSIYRLRNMLVHNMRRFPAGAATFPPQVNDFLEVIVPHLLISFVVPPEDRVAA